MTSSSVIGIIEIRCIGILTGYGLEIIKRDTGYSDHPNWGPTVWCPGLFSLKNPFSRFYVGLLDWAVSFDTCSLCGKNYKCNLYCRDVRFAKIYHRYYLSHLKGIQWQSQRYLYMYIVTSWRAIAMNTERCAKKIPLLGSAVCCFSVKLSSYASSAVKRIFIYFSYGFIQCFMEK